MAPAVRRPGMKDIRSAFNQISANLKPTIRFVFVHLRHRQGREVGHETTLVQARGSKPQLGGVGVTMQPRALVPVRHAHPLLGPPWTASQYADQPEQRVLDLR